MSWFKWDTYLKHGRHKAATLERPLPSGGQTKRVLRLPDGAIGLKLHDTYCVIFHTDDTVTYNTGGWNTITTRKFINEYGPTRVFSVKSELRLQTDNPTVTPPKIGKCRMCKGSGQVPRTCYGPSYCYASHMGRECEHGSTTNHRLETCAHGRDGSHGDGLQGCSRCAGSGQVDYGSKRVYPEWDGTPYRFHPDDPTAGTDNVTALGQPIEPWTAPNGVTSVKGESYSNSGGILTTLMPDILADVKYPCKCGMTPATVKDVVIHLNDGEKWTRERIADWLDTLDLNLRFPTPA